MPAGLKTSLSGSACERGRQSCETFHNPSSTRESYVDGEGRVLCVCVKACIDVMSPTMRAMSLSCVTFRQRPT